MAAQFSEDGKYFAKLTTDGKLKIWNTIANTFEQEFTPDFHLTAPCTCLYFIHSSSKAASPKKKKRKLSESHAEPNIALGTTSGLLLVYSISKSSVEYTINSETSEVIHCLHTADDSNLYSGTDQNVLVWNLGNRKLHRKWKAGNDKISAILAIPNSSQILTASKNIKLWDVESKEVLHTFTGHSSEVTCLHYILPSLSSTGYILSGSKGDRLLNCWSVSENTNGRNAIASFLMEDVVESIAVNISNEGTTNMLTTIRNGAVHLFQHTLNGKRNKPVKPKTTIQVVSDTGQSKNTVMPIRILGATFRDNETLCIGYGSGIILQFENIAINTHKKLQCLIRKDNFVAFKDQDQSTKTITPAINDAHYLTTQTSTVGQTSTNFKRKQDGGTQEIPMEKRLENLSLKPDGNNTPKAGSMAQLLIQGLHSRDANILRTVLVRKDEDVIVNTVRRLPINVLVPLLQELSKFVEGKTLSSQIGSLWMRHILAQHSSVLVSNPHLPALLGPTLGGVDRRLELRGALCRLKGRLELLMPQISGATAMGDGFDGDERPVLTYDDRDDSDDTDAALELEMEVHSETDNEWEEESIEEQPKENNVENGSNDSESEMST